MVSLRPGVILRLSSAMSEYLAILVQGLRLLLSLALLCESLFLPYTRFVHVGGREVDELLIADACGLLAAEHGGFEAVALEDVLVEAEARLARQVHHM